MSKSKQQFMDIKEKEISNDDSDYYYDITKPQFYKHVIGFCKNTKNELIMIEGTSSDAVLRKMRKLKYTIVNNGVLFYPDIKIKV